MTVYYNALVVITCASLLILMELVHDNGRLSAETKKFFYYTYGMIILAAVTEWCAIFLNGAPMWTRWIHAVVKCMDYIFTPLAGIMFVRQIFERDKQFRYMIGVIIANAVFQIISIFTGWTYYIDEKNIYHHGPCYFVYVLVYILVIVFVVIQFYRYGKMFRKHNKTSFVMIVLFVSIGICVQELSGGQARISYICLTIGSVLLFIHSNEYKQQKNDDELMLQKTLLEIDPLTDMKSRYAYMNDLKQWESMDALPEDIIVFMIDINGLKAVNDRLGHRAGDELIIGVADCIMETFNAYGECYRTGGDEFVVIVRAEGSRADVLSARLQTKIAGWSGRFTDHASASCGYALRKEHPERSIENLISIADEHMYEQKARYYEQEGYERGSRQSF